MIFCPVNTSDDSDAMNQNTNQYAYGRIEYRKSGGGWIECNNQGSTSQQGGQKAHIEMSPNRTGDSTTDYWSGNRYRMEHKCSTILVLMSVTVEMEVLFNSNFVGMLVIRVVLYKLDNLMVMALMIIIQCNLGDSQFLNSLPIQTHTQHINHGI